MLKRNVTITATSFLQLNPIHSCLCIAALFKNCFFFYHYMEEHTVGCEIPKYKLPFGWITRTAGQFVIR